jgi:hypothetical protein
MAAPLTPLRRSSRSSAKRRNLVLDDYHSYPDGPPVTQFEKWVCKLDKQSFPLADFARIDDIVVAALFATKKNPNFYRALLPSRAFLEEGMAVPIDVALDICHIYTRFAKGSTDSPEVASQVTALWVAKYPKIFGGKCDEEILNQYVFTPPSE